MKYFLDTEFHEYMKPVKFLGITIGKIPTIELISIGIKAENGKEFYAINKEFNIKNAIKNEWLRDNVLSFLPNRKSKYQDQKVYEKTTRQLSMRDIRKEILEFVKASSENEDDKPEFYGYYGSYDWVVFCWIFGRMIDLPNGFPMYIRDLKQELDVIATNKATLDKTSFEVALKELKELPYYPKQVDEHHALKDARWNYDLYKFILKCYSQM